MSSQIGFKNVQSSFLSVAFFPAFLVVLPFLVFLACFFFPFFPFFPFPLAARHSSSHAPSTCRAQHESIRIDTATAKKDAEKDEELAKKDEELDETG